MFVRSVLGQSPSPPPLEPFRTPPRFGVMPDSHPLPGHLLDVGGAGPQRARSATGVSSLDPTMPTVLDKVDR